MYKKNESVNFLGNYPGKPENVLARQLMVSIVINYPDREFQDSLNKNINNFLIEVF